AAGLTARAPRSAPRTRPAEEPARRFHVRNHDRRGGFAAELLDLLDRLLDRALDAVGELLDRLVERGRVELERDRKHAACREHLRLTHVEDLALGIGRAGRRSEEHTSELQSLAYLVCRLLLEK